MNSDFNKKKKQYFEYKKLSVYKKCIVRYKTKKDIIKHGSMSQCQRPVMKITYDALGCNKDKVSDDGRMPSR